MCKSLTEALVEDIIEITWMFDGLIDFKKIPPWDDLIERFCGSDGIKQEIKDIAYEFEGIYPYDTTWEDGELDYLTEIQNFARKKLIEVFGE